MDETFLSLLGARLKEARSALGLTQEEAAKLVGVTREHWGRCERGQVMPGGEVFSALALAGADANYLLTGKLPTVTADGYYAKQQVSAPITAQERALLDNYRHAGSAGQAALDQTSAALAQSKAMRKSA